MSKIHTIGETYWIGLTYTDGTWMWNSGEKLTDGRNWEHWVWIGKYRQIEPTSDQSKYACANVQTGEQSGTSVETTKCDCTRPVVCIKCKLCRHSICGD